MVKGSLWMTLVSRPPLYTIVVSKTAAKKFKKFPKDARDAIQGDLFRLEIEPQLGKLLKPPLDRYRSLRVHGNRNEYRVIYQTDSKNHRILVAYIAPREKVYKNIKPLV